MRTDIAYAVVDERGVSQQRRMPLIGCLTTFPGGIELYGGGRYGITVLTSQDEEAFEEDDDGTIRLHTKKGRLVLRPLTLKFLEEVRPYLGPDQPTFETDEDAQQYHWDGLMERR